MVHQSRLMKRMDLLVILWSVGLKPLGRIVLLDPDSCFITTIYLKVRFAELSFFVITQAAFLRREKSGIPRTVGSSDPSVRGIQYLYDFVSASGGIRAKQIL